MKNPIRAINFSVASYWRGIGKLDEVDLLRILFDDDELQRMANDPNFKSKKWSSDLVKAYRKKIQILTSATDERDLRALKSLHLEQLKGNRIGTSSIRLNKQYRLILQFKSDESGRTVIVIELVDYH
ncbi:MAG: type II toxin-antitoxin system RelE/ParE family toxin [Corynebacterium casei]|uniref:Plasmid maintenance system killer protein n=2 Tax=Corynebacterium casei TaxID=160386 RepID=A0ABM5PRD7_9CORY|nr:type II toxin-antitoxin system RelE/ParE family toxin [Corynebacterium casei]MDN6149594.1 type II toxin-antitoxin system RelE/ParE family toxin [Yaniella sp.]AHI20652.1 Plasmid maintenance system killer protein [Corynebacterium casei LMG S-19264]MDN5705938.1 type II toxin-antitoxin system RelE/ParE family toxin [Corynebacterium casei]MDN5729886.1 type II toxin-antitoxin system RelE/ParE family toxin [Corynebacterium casei]MDN5741477.1 type II toxin-antitoxin system RelE/ParE family toxin [C